jgi:hypothetical protein
MKKVAALLLLMVMTTISSFGQITTSTISGVVKDKVGEPLPGATVQATHVPTGTKYYSITSVSGVFTIPAVRPGGPYTIQVSFVGFKKSELTEVTTSLGVTTNVEFVLQDETTALSEVVVVASTNNTFSKERTGATQQLSRGEITSVPTIGSRTINSITRYNPYGDGSSFGGQDPRLNNFTIDGSQFNNNFGLGSSAQAGGRTGSSAISLDAIDQLQVNIAPFDIRQSGFTGAGINAVTRSGTNNIEGSVYTSNRNNSNNFTGTKAGGVEITPATFSEQVNGFRVGAPIVKDKLFIFANMEQVTNIQPGTNWISDGSPLSGTQISRVKYQDMLTLSNFMREKFNYETGPWEGYDNENNSLKGLLRLDWNINDKHKLTARYVHHNSDAEINVSNSQSAGAGNRTTQFNAMSFQNSGYTIQDNTRSSVLELNSKFSNTLHNNLIVGYDKQIENRGYLSQLFPTIDIREGAATYTSVGMDPFTPGNRLDYSTFHITNNLTKFYDKHTLVGGINFEKYQSNNMFFPASQGVYVFNSLADFYTAANQSIANGGGPSTFAPERFQLRYSALPNGAEPLQVLKTTRFDFYAQDEWNATNKLRLTFGIRGGLIDIGNTGLENPAVTAMTFANGERFNTSVLPKTQLLWEPRFGFNYDVKGDATTQIRGGSGIFTGRPPYVFISNAVGNNGVLTGFIDVSGANAQGYGFTTNPNQYFIPSTPTLPSRFDLAFTDPNYKYPQVWKSNIAVDQRLPFGLIGTIEYLYNRDINATHYYDANLEGPTGTFNGVDNRPRYANTDNGVRVNDNVSRAAVLTNINGGYYQGLTAKIEKPFSKGVWGSVAYTRSVTRDFMSAGSIASGSWQSARSVNGNNDLPLSYSDRDNPNRIVGLLGYRKEYGGKLGGATTVTLGYVATHSGNEFGFTGARYSYVVSGDMNGDRVRDNDLMFVPNSASDLRFDALTTGGVTFTSIQQRDALEAFINQDPYLSTRRGQYAERNGALMPLFGRMDFSITQDVNVKIKGEKNAFQVRFDVLNFGNMLNSDWGVSQRPTTPFGLLSYVRTDADGVPVYKMGTQKLADGSTVLARDSFQKNSSIFDVWQAQLTLRYTFGR